MAPTRISVPGVPSVSRTHSYISGGASSGPVAPPLSASLSAYWRMDAVGTMTVAGGLVSQVNDLSGNNKHLTQTGSARPVYETANGGQVKFDGATQYLSIPSGVSVNRRAVSMFVVMRRNNGPDTMSLVHFSTSASDLALYHANDGTLTTYDGSGAVGSSIQYGGAAAGSGTGNRASGAFEAPWLIGDASASYMGLGPQLYTKGSAISSGTSSGGYIGMWNGLAFPFKGAVKAVLIYNRALTLTEKDSVLAFLEGQFSCVPKAASTFIVTDGDSITQGVQSGDEFNLSYPMQMSRLGSLPFKLWNNGSGGESLVTAGNLAATAPISKLVGNSSYTNRVVVALWGTNDLGTGRTDVQLKADLDTYIANIRAGASGAKIYMGTLLPRAAFSGTQNTYMDNVNAYIRSGAAHDGYIELHNDSRLSNASNTTYYDPDGTHPNAAGYAVIASLVRARLVTAGVLT